MTHLAVPYIYIYICREMYYSELGAGKLWGLSNYQC